MSDGVLPELVDIEIPDGHLVVRWLPAAVALEFPRLPQTARRSIPSVVRRLFKAAAEHAQRIDSCLICESSAPIRGRVLLAIEVAGAHEFGVVCESCWRIGERPDQG
jgi:hypothetical protein